MASKYQDAHKSPQGPGDGRPTAHQILVDEGVIGKLSDKVFLITGATDGLGKETVRQLAKTGARVFFTARNEEKAEKMLQELKDQAKDDAELKDSKVEWIKMDNASLKSVKEGAEAFLKKSDKLNVLVCNAGIANTPYKMIEETGMEQQFTVNHLAHFLLLRLLTPILLRSSTPNFNSRVVTVASSAHALGTVQFGNYNLDTPPKETYDPLCEIEGDHRSPMLLYAQTKTANIWMANEVERRYGHQGLHGLSLHPGGILTAGFYNMDPRISEKFASLLEMEMIKKEFKTVEQGAATQVCAAIGKEFEGKGGLYLDNCAVAEPIPEGGFAGLGGYKPWAYDVDGQKRLWKESLEMLGLKDDQ